MPRNPMPRNVLIGFLLMFLTWPFWVAEWIARKWIARNGH